MKNYFTIITPVFNAEKFISGCVNSILNQNYDNFRLIIIDDNSSDSTADFLRTISDPRCQTIFNTVRLGALNNIINAINITSDIDYDIIVTVDGDDQLSDEAVLSYLNEEYNNRDCWMTYGTFIPISGKYGPYGNRIPDISKYRRGGEWLASHLRTFRRKLWTRISDKDLRDDSGAYFQTAWDAAFMFPMLEMAGNKKAAFIDRIMYVYNDVNPINDMKVNQRSQIDNASLIRARPMYGELTDI
jgi:glycosyltransferase involved in cell wall biosynthesis